MNNNNVIIINSNIVNEETESEGRGLLGDGRANESRMEALGPPRPSLAHELQALSSETISVLSSLWTGMPNLESFKYVGHNYFLAVL